MPLIRPGVRHLDDYADSVGPNVLTMLRRLAAQLAGLRILHVSAGPYGSAVADTLAALVPLQRDLGLQADWHLLRGDAPRVWSALYEGLSGFNVRWGDRERQAWYAYAKRHAGVVAGGYDVVVAHDPQAVALARVASPEADRMRWIWHCHLDTRDARPEVWSDLQQALEPYVAAFFPSPALVRTDLPIKLSGVARPAIDPEAPRNAPMERSEVEQRLGRLGLDPRRPIAAQFAPIDHRYGPISALGAYWIARREVKGLQIVLAELTASFSERARQALDQVADAAGGDADVYLLTAQAGLSQADLCALEHGTTVALQLAVPRGFGWGLAECQWKGKPSVVGRHGQLPEQVEEGRCGLVATGAPEAAAAVVRLASDSMEARVLGRRAHERVARDNLITGLLGDYLRLFRRIADAQLG